MIHEEGRKPANAEICGSQPGLSPGLFLALLLHMRYHEKGSREVISQPSGLNRMKRERLLRLFCAVLAAIFLPALGSAQESQSSKAKKKSESETATPPDLTKVETTEERRENLDKKLDSSLSEFDGLILKEQEILEQRREESAAAGGGGGAGTAEIGGGSGAGGGDEEGASGGAEGPEGKDAKGARGSGGSKDDPAGEPVGTEEGAPVTGGDSEKGEISNGRVPPDVGDGSDDDIVARQLREAAMKEEDPELREKLWDEYRAYKFGEKKKETGK
jgi:hypothetical protein